MTGVEKLHRMEIVKRRIESLSKMTIDETKRIADEEGFPWDPSGNHKAWLSFEANQRGEQPLWLECQIVPDGLYWLLIAGPRRYVNGTVSYTECMATGHSKTVLLVASEDQPGISCKVYSSEVDLTHSQAHKMLGLLNPDWSGHYFLPLSLPQWNLLAGMLLASPATEYDQVMHEPLIKATVRELV